LGEPVRSARDGEQEQDDPDGHEKQSAAVRPWSRLFRSGRRIFGWLAHLDWVE
jgi:hypothetical protein